MKLTIQIFLLLALVMSCSPEKEITKKIEPQIQRIEKIVVPVLNLKVIKTYAWINLMPNLPEKFHISGELELLRSTNYEIQFTDMKTISLFQKGELLYQIRPKVVVDESLSDEQKKHILYSTISGVSVHPFHKIDEPMRAEFNFVEGGKEYIYTIEGITLEKVY
ncbi:MAG: hypothetical protein ABIJ40_17685 [Bacteroidota bacterium]